MFRIDDIPLDEACKRCDAFTKFYREKVETGLVDLKIHSVSEEIDEYYWNAYAYEAVIGRSFLFTDIQKEKIRNIALYVNNMITDAHDKARAHMKEAFPLHTPRV